MEDGQLLIIKTAKRSDTVRITNKLFGRVTKVKDKEYCYKGILSDKKLFKIARGVYFIVGEVAPSDNYDLIPTRMETENLNVK